MKIRITETKLHWVVFLTAQLLMMFSAAYAANLPGGRYIVTVASSQKCVNVPNGSTADGVQLQQLTCNSSVAQQFDINPTDNGYYKIINANSGKAVDIRGSSTADGGVAQQYTWNNSNAQHYLLQTNGKGFVLRNRNSGKCLDLKDWNSADGGLLQQMACTGGANQTFQLTPTAGANKTVEDGRYSIKSVNSGRCLDVPNSSTADSVQLQQWGCNGTATQQYDFTYVGNSLYEIMNANSGKCVDLRSGGTGNGTAIQQYSCNQGVNQRFYAKGMGDGSFQFNPYATTRVFDVYNASTADGSKIQIWDNANSANQKWNMTKVAYTPNMTDATYKIVAVHSNKCLDVPNSSTSPGQQIQQYSCNGTNAQNFTVAHQGDGYYKIANVTNGLSLAVRDFSAGTKAIEQSDPHGGNNQLFRFVPYGSGYLIRPKSSYLCFDINGASTSDGALLQQQTCNYNNNQVYKFQLSSSSSSTLPSGTANSDTVVLLHGFAGWDRNEMFGLKYWGGGWSGSMDLQEYLKSQGHNTVTLGVGPISSNWDRAVEAYYELKGGCVDYGAAHSARHGHNRNGRCFTARTPTWDDSHKVHIISHSQGGQTGRMLIELLRNGSQAERDASGSSVSDLYKGGKNWVHSLTTVSTPHNGTTLTNVVQMLGITQKFVEMAYGVAGMISGENVVYDLKLDQWNLLRNQNEGFTSYSNRVNASPIWTSSYDTSLWDLSPDGAKEMNQWVHDFSDIYYFSFSTKSTYKAFWDGKQYPIISTFTPFIPQSFLMGRYTHNDPTKVIIDSSWWPNDSVVNTSSMKAPSGSLSTDYTYNGFPQVGIWNNMSLLNGWDHLDVTGMFCAPFCNINSLYLNHVKLLKTLY